MPHANAPLTPAGRLRLIERCRTRPIAHVAAEAGISRACLSKWNKRYEQHGPDGLEDRSSTPWTSPGMLDAFVIDEIETMRREHKWSATRIATELALRHDVTVSPRTIGRWFERLGINRRRDLDPSGASNRQPAGKITARFPGHMVHLDVKKVGVIPDGGGWRVHGRGSAQHKASKRGAKKRRAGYSYFHTAIDGFSRLAYSESLPDEKAKTTIAFWARAMAFFAAHGITRIVRVITDNGANYRAGAFADAVRGFVSRHQYTRPYTPRHNGKVERFNRILAEEFLYARVWGSEQQRADALGVWIVHYNYHRPHSAAGHRPPATRVHARVTNVTPSYS